MDFELPEGADREYLIIFGVAAVYVGTIPVGEPCIVGATRDLERTYQAMREKWPWSEIGAAFWVKDRDTAEVIASEVNGVLPHDANDRLDCRAERARVEIERVARDWKISLTNHDAAMARVQAAVRRVGDLIERANVNGDLSWFNTAYRDWRLAAKKVGRGMSYAEARARLRKAVTKRLICHDKLEMNTDLLDGLFPELPEVTGRKFRETALTGQKNGGFLRPRTPRHTHVRSGRAALPKGPN
ncbi:hypothetical protein [Bradyrhizobium valentinum]|uniref:Uncharacterized protein n=1 Tax=Bradyrhizobium valentinum TaxID=1518501 RepID=A0A0R3KU84_9BRAD|nr:hypothetical protein [Bradyrhizobium valentinum]KRQ99256.1 hypothetical protein CP49_11705 [Bradyrhizobium valentinum]